MIELKTFDFKWKLSYIFNHNNNKNIMKKHDIICENSKLLYHLFDEIEKMIFVVNVRQYMIREYYRLEFGETVYYYDQFTGSLYPELAIDIRDRYRYIKRLETYIKTISECCEMMTHIISKIYDREK